MIHQPKLQPRGLISTHLRALQDYAKRSRPARAPWILTKYLPSGTVRIPLATASTLTDTESEARWA